MATVNSVFTLPLDPIDLPGSVMLRCTYQAFTMSHCLLDLGALLDLPALSHGQACSAQNALLELYILVQSSCFHPRALSSLVQRLSVVVALICLCHTACCPWKCPGTLSYFARQAFSTGKALPKLCCLGCCRHNSVLLCVVQY